MRRFLVWVTCGLLVTSLVVASVFSDRLLMLGVEQNSYPLTRVALLLGADIDRVHYEEHFQQTPLMVAIRLQNDSITDLLLRRGADVNATTGNGDSALISAARALDAVMIERLCDMGAQVQQEGRLGTAMSHALISRRQEDAILSLLERGGRMHPTNQAELLWREILRGDSSRAEKLLKAGASPNLPAQTPLQAAAQAGECYIAMSLVRAGADPRATDCSGKTPGDIARKAGHKECADLLDAAAAEGGSTGASRPEKTGARNR